VVRTRVGYAGGTKPEPTYHGLGDHTESFQVDFDPSRISFERLLELFWAEHDPTERPGAVQYRNILFFQDEEQEQAARASRERLAADLGAPVRTEVRRLERFWPAEDYHQKYGLRGDRHLMQVFVGLCGGDGAPFRESPAAAKVNAYLAGDLPYAGLRQQLASLGWEAVGERRLEDLRPLPAAAAAR
jgi:peptide-methionine (S)-S-oxide reductase